MQGAGSQPDVNTAEPTEKEVSEMQATPKDPKDDHPVQNTESPATAAPTGTLTLETPLTKELVNLKAEQARLKEIAGSFTISHIIPTETVASQSQGHFESVLESEDNYIRESNSEHLQEAKEDGSQEQRDLEMESVD